MSYQGYGTRGAHDRRAQVAQALMASSVNQTPQNMGEGISAIGRALFGMLASRANNRQEREGQASAQRSTMQPIIDLLVAQNDPRAAAFTSSQAEPATPEPARITSPIETSPIPPQGFNLPAIEAAVEAGPVDPVVASAQAAGLDPEAWRRQIQVESGGDPNAVSPANATGLAQVMPATARDPGFGVPTIFEVARQLGRPVPDEGDATLQALLRDPQVNATFGAMYQRAMLDQHGGDPALAAAAYNAGPGAVARANGVPNFPETQQYVQNVQPRLADPMAGATMSAQAQAPTSQPAQPAADPRAQLLPLLMQAAGNEWLPEGQRAVVQAMLQRELQGSPEGTSAMREYNLARQQGFQGSFLDYRRSVAEAGRTTVDARNMGAVPPGYQAVRDAQGNVMRLEPIPGGPAAAEAEAANASTAAAAEQGVRSTGVVLEDIGRLRSLVEEQQWYDPVTGIGGMISAWRPGSARADAEALAETIGANIGFDRLQEMREASPTGGALGNVTERELAALRAVQGSIAFSQSEGQLLENLERLDTMYREIMRKFSAYPNAAEFGITPPEAEEPSVEELLQRYGG